MLGVVGLDNCRMVYLFSTLHFVQFKNNDVKVCEWRVDGNGFHDFMYGGSETTE